MCVILDGLLLVKVQYKLLHFVLAKPVPLFGQQQPAPYQRGPPQEYLEAITNKRLIEEVE
jgi:hypothetical protein